MIILLIGIVTLYSFVVYIAITNDNHDEPDEPLDAFEKMRNLSHNIDSSKPDQECRHNLMSEPKGMVCLKCGYSLYENQ